MKSFFYYFRNFFIKRTTGSAPISINLICPTENTSPLRSTQTDCSFLIPGVLFITRLCIGALQIKAKSLKLVKYVYAIVESF